MKTSKFTLIGVIVLFTSILFSCTTKSGGAGGGGPIVQNPVAAYIKSVTVSPASLTFDGQENPATSVTISVNADGTPPVSYTLDGKPAGSSIPISGILETKGYTVAVSNTAGSDSKIVTVPVTITPRVSAFALTWKNVYREYKDPGGTWQLWIIPVSDTGKVIQFLPNGKALQFTSGVTQPLNLPDWHFVGTDSIFGGFNSLGGRYSITPAGKLQRWFYDLNGVQYHYLYDRH